MLFFCPKKQFFSFNFCTFVEIFEGRKRLRTQINALLGDFPFFVEGCKLPFCRLLLNIMHTYILNRYKYYKNKIWMKIRQWIMIES